MRLCILSELHRGWEQSHPDNQERRPEALQSHPVAAMNDRNKADQLGNGGEGAADAGDNRCGASRQSLVISRPKCTFGPSYENYARWVRNDDLAEA